MNDCDFDKKSTFLKMIKAQHKKVNDEKENIKQSKDYNNPYKHLTQGKKYIYDVVEKHVVERKTQYGAIQSQMMRTLSMNIEQQANS